MFKKNLKAKISFVTILLLIVILLLKNIYKGVPFYNYGWLNAFQVWRSLYIQAPTIDSFYWFSFNEYNIDYENSKITIKFYRKPIFLVWSNQSDIINIWIDKEGSYKLYYIDEKWNEQFIRDITYSKNSEDKCVILK